MIETIPNKFLIIIAHFIMNLEIQNFCVYNSSVKRSIVISLIPLSHMVKIYNNNPLKNEPYLL